MTAPATRALHGLFKWALGIGILVAVLLALLVAWWIAFLVVGALLIYSGVRRLLRGKRAATATHMPVSIIEGEFRVEYDPQTQSPPRVLETSDPRAKD